MSVCSKTDVTAGGQSLVEGVPEYSGIDRRPESEGVISRQHKARALTGLAIVSGDPGKEPACHCRGHGSLPHPITATLHRARMATVGQGVGSCDDGMVNRPIGYWIKRLDASLEAQLDSTLTRLRLTRRQWHVLDALASGPVAPAAVSDILRLFNSGGHDDVQEREMAALVREGLVFLLDGRLALTESGHAMHTRVSALVEATGRDLTAGIGADEYAMAVSVLERMSHNAERLAGR